MVHRTEVAVTSHSRLTLKPLELFEGGEGWQVVDDNDNVVFDNQTYYPTHPSREWAEHIVASVNATLAKPASEPAGGGVLPIVSALLRVTCQSLDHGGESMRSLRALAVETAWDIISDNDDPRFEAERRACDADPWAYVRKMRLLDRAALSSPASSSPAEAEALQAGVEAVFPAYGEQDWSDLADAVSNAIYDKDGMVLFDADIYPGHQMVRHINFNSLNRIVTWFVKRALSSAPAQEDGA